MERCYFCIDLKSFYASVECVERGLDPLTARLVVADEARSEKTICLAVSPALKKLGVPGRCRLFEVPRALDFIVARPRMRLYITYAARIFSIYLQYISSEDIHVYSIDEAFLDVTKYLELYHMTPKAFATQLMRQIRQQVGVVSTCGIGTNLYLAKVALDITAKHSESAHGEERIGMLTEADYCSTLRNHRPLTDFWRVGRGTAARLARYGIFTMGQIARANEMLLYRLFGVDAELLIDHAWGRESTTMKDIKAFRAQTHSLCRGQVLPRDYSVTEARLIVCEMVEGLSLELVAEGLTTGCVGLSLGYSGREKQTGTSAALPVATNSTRRIREQVLALFDRVADQTAMVRRVTLTFEALREEDAVQYDLFTDVAEQERERKLQQTMVRIRRRFGRNAVFRGMDLQREATMLERNQQIGGHWA